MGAGRWDWDRERPHSGPLPAPPFPSGASHDCLKPPRKGFVSPVAALPFPAAPRPAPNRRHRGFCSLTAAPAHLSSEPALRPHWPAPKRREEISHSELEQRARPAPPLAGTAEAGKTQPMGARAAAVRGTHEASPGGKGRLSQSECAQHWPRPPGSHLLTERGSPLRAPNPPHGLGTPQSRPNPPPHIPLRTPTSPSEPPTPPRSLGIPQPPPTSPSEHPNPP